MNSNSEIRTFICILDEYLDVSDSDWAIAHEFYEEQLAIQLQNIKKNGHYDSLMKSMPYGYAFIKRIEQKGVSL
jgi:hypothetical protein